MRAPSAQDLDLLAAVDTFLIDEDANHIRIIAIGTHDKKFMKQAKNFPKYLIGLPWKVDYHLKVPSMCDLAIDARLGDHSKRHGKLFNSGPRLAWAAVGD